MRFFNTAGPCFPGEHYMLPAVPRLPGVRDLIDRKQYFVIHAPRQSGKTTALRELAHALTAEGTYAALYASCERAEVAQDNVEWAERMLWDAIGQKADLQLPAECQPPPLAGDAEGSRLAASLKAWAERCPRPLVVFFDEIDALRGDSLRSVLRQLRDGFSQRPGAFPWSVALCGLRDVRDYKAASGGDPERLGTSSPFNIKTSSLRLEPFTARDVATLYGQHTADTGQPFEPAALERAMDATGGQPWLVNALAREVVQQMGVAPPEPITRRHIDQARERLILARQTHLDSLVARLREPRVQAIVEPLIAGGLVLGDIYDDDFSYVRDLGLIAPDRPLRVANDIYREVIVRVLAGKAEENISDDPRSYVLADGSLDEDRIFTRFLAFWREHGDVLSGAMPYHEVAPQLVLMAWLQSVVNGRGHIDREYGVGRGRIDLLLRWPMGEGEQRIAIELKVWRDKQGDPLQRGLEQLDAYLSRLGMDRGWLVIFDRRAGAAEIDERSHFEEAETASGRPVRVLRG